MQAINLFQQGAVGVGNGTNEAETEATESPFALTVHECQDFSPNGLPRLRSQLAGQAPDLLLDVGPGRRQRDGLYDFAFKPGRR
jgi:hypothetical protein